MRVRGCSVKRVVAVLAFAVALSGCASYSGTGLLPGVSNAADVERVMGTPAEVRRFANGEMLLWYPRFPYGRESFAARLAPDGKLMAIEPRMSEENLYRLERNKATRDDVLDLLGPPYRRDPFPRMDRDIWTYPMRDNAGEWWLGLVQLSPDGVVREVYYIRDPETVRPGGSRH